MMATWVLDVFDVLMKSPRGGNGARRLVDGSLFSSADRPAIGLGH
jgi:hypothetical protein